MSTLVPPLEDAADGTWLRRALIVALWFLLNISIGIITKWLYLYEQVCFTDAECHHFNFPLGMTCMHLLSSQVITYFYIFHIRKSANGAELDWTARARKVGPLAACFAISVGFGNVALKYLFPSFKSMVGAGTPVVTVVMSVMFTQTKYNWWTWASMPLICGGLFICSQDEVNFSTTGLAFALTAMVMRSAKSIVQARLLSRDERIDPVTLLYYMSPFALAFLVVMTLAAEGTAPFVVLWRGGLEWLAAGRPSSAAAGPGGAAGWPRLVLVLLLSGLNACFLNITGFFVTRCTSAVTLQVLGVVKSCLGIAASVAVLRNPIRGTQVAGAALSFLGVWLYERKSSSRKPFGGPKGK